MDWQSEPEDRPAPAVQPSEPGSPEPGEIDNGSSRK